MFGSTILDLAIGLIFTFLIVSLVTSAATETVASALSWRSNTLLQGIKDMLNDPQFNGLALALYNHGLVNPQSSGNAANEAQLSAQPSYIDKKQFADAVIDLTGVVAGANVADMQAKINAAVPDPQVRGVLNSIVARAGADIDDVRTGIADWFDNAMDRVSGVYKRKTQWWSLGIGLVLVIALNVDAIKIAQTLWDQPMLVKSLPPVSNITNATDALNQLQKLGLPFGWDWDHKASENQKASGDQKAPGDTPPAPKWWSAPLGWGSTIFGWLITAVATLFGAPFWFDTLQRFVQLRGTGDGAGTSTGTSGP
jgi:hypothetical protein